MGRFTGDTLFQNKGDGRKLSVKAIVTCQDIEKGVGAGGRSTPIREGWTCDLFKKRMYLTLLPKKGEVRISTVRGGKNVRLLIKRMARQTQEQRWRKGELQRSKRLRWDTSVKRKRGKLKRVLGRKQRSWEG